MALSGQKIRIKITGSDKNLKLTRERKGEREEGRERETGRERERDRKDHFSQFYGDTGL